MKGTIEMETTNEALISGEIKRIPEYSHCTYGEKFYLTEVEVIRDSGNVDKILVMISDRLTKIEYLQPGNILYAEGQFRSYNDYTEKKTKLILYFFAQYIEVLVNNEAAKGMRENKIFLDGFICKDPVYRKTPLGREITDVILAVNRAHGKSDYIPCIFWGRNALFVSNMKVGERIRLEGRIQSRDYLKKISEEEYETRTAREVSVYRLEVVESEECKDQVADAE